MRTRSLLEEPFPSRDESTFANLYISALSPPTAYNRVILYAFRSWRTTNAFRPVGHERERRMRLFERWHESRRRAAPRRESTRSAESRSPGTRPRRRARPEAEALDPRLLMASGQAGPADLSDQVAAIVQQDLAQGQFPGISVAVVTDGQVALAQGYGLASVKARMPVEADTRFDIGSVTKTFTAMAVLLLYQDSQGTSHPLDLNAPIGDDLHNTGSFKLPRRWAQITPMELLNMTSGITEVEDARPWKGQLSSVANAPLRFAPGTATAYSDPNYYLLGELIEQWTGEKYSTYIQDQILDPLGMSGTQVLGGSTMVANQAVGYGAPKHGHWSKAALWTGTSMYAAAGMVSNAQDMATYMTALLDGRILDPATYQLMWTSTPTPIFNAKPAATAVRGLGWDTAIDSSSGPIEVTKSGQVNGYTTQLILNPSTDTGVFVSINTYHNGPNPTGTIALNVAEAIDQAIQSGSGSGG